MFKAYFSRFSGPKNSSQIYGFRYYLPVVQLPRKTYHFKSRQSKNNVVHRVLYPLLTNIEGAMDAPALVKQFTHLVNPDPSYRLSYLLRHFADKAGKVHNRK